VYCEREQVASDSNFLLVLFSLFFRFFTSLSLAFVEFVLSAFISRSFRFSLLLSFFKLKFSNSSKLKMPRTYVDNAFNRSVGRVGMEHGTAVISSSGGGGGGRSSSYSGGGGGYSTPSYSSYSSGGGGGYSSTSYSSGGSSSGRSYVDNSMNRFGS